MQDAILYMRHISQNTFYTQLLALFSSIICRMCLLRIEFAMRTIAWCLEEHLCSLQYSFCATQSDKIDYKKYISVLNYYYVCPRQFCQLRLCSYWHIIFGVGKFTFQLAKAQQPRAWICYPVILSVILE